MRSENARLIMAGVGVTFRSDPPLLSRVQLDDLLDVVAGSPRGGKPSGVAAAAAQAAWDTL